MRKNTDILIKVLSLGIGLSVGIVLIAKVFFELSYDSFYKDIGRVYTINTWITMQGSEKDYGQVSGAVSVGFMEEVPGVEAGTRTTFVFNGDTYLDLAPSAIRDQRQPGGIIDDGYASAHLPAASGTCLCICITDGDPGVAGKGHEWKNHGRPWPCERAGPKLCLGGMKRSESFSTVPPGCGARRLEIQTSTPGLPGEHFSASEVKPRSREVRQHIKTLQK